MITRAALFTLAESIAPSLDWDDGPWAAVVPLPIARFHSRTGSHRPKTEAKLLLARDTLHVIFCVADRYVRSLSTRYQDPVSRDSCVELFVQPAPQAGYFNFEFSCGGVMLLYYIEDPGTAETGLAKFTPVPADIAAMVRVESTLPRVNPNEIAGPIEWRLSAAIPLNVVRAIIGPFSTDAGTIWRANLYKCGDRTRHPHWAAWADVGPVLNFHQPDRFGELILHPAAAPAIDSARSLP